ncbi:MAG TPA: tetratricopeptide repeat protein, partial [Bacteroidia bacterium]|nr:tetratricopeptide repeat protein [Bacteroidia bacterium]
NQEAASMYLRIFLVDKNVDADVSKDAKDEFQLGETAFQNGKFESAERHYMDAYKMDTTYYKAALYVGDAYFNDKEYELALPWYQKAVNMQPDLLEGRKYLTDVYMKLHKWKEAYDACLDAIVVYPDVGMFIKLKSIADELDKKFDRHWIARFNLPNRMVLKQDIILTPPWSFYRDAKIDVATTSDELGIIKGQEGSMKYLEVYSWTKMLEQDKDNADLDFARKMSKEGFLDCYVFISMFHYTIYDQYADFAKHNADRIRKYIDTYIVQ